MFSWIPGVYISRNWIKTPLKKYVSEFLYIFIFITFLGHDTISFFICLNRHKFKHEFQNNELFYSLTSLLTGRQYCLVITQFRVHSCQKGQDRIEYLSIKWKSMPTLSLALKCVLRSICLSREWVGVFPHGHTITVSMSYPWYLLLIIRPALSALPIALWCKINF